MSNLVAGLTKKELDKKLVEYNLFWKQKNRKTHNREKWVSKRVKQLLKYATVVGYPRLTDLGPICPRCSKIAEKEEVWGRFNVYEYYSCACGWEYGNKHGKPVSYSLGYQ